MMWLEFTLSSAIIVIAGTFLVKYADSLSDRFHLSKVWVGIVLLGFVTSLPEAATSFIAISSVGAPNLAVGNMLGSNNFNLMIVVALDFLYRRGSVTDSIKTNTAHIFSSMFAMILSVIVLISIFASRFVSAPAMGHLSLGGVFIAVIYIGGIVFLSRSKQSNYSATTQNSTNSVSLHTILFYLAASIILVLIGARWLALAADKIALSTTLGRTFVGSIFLAFVTSLPEIVVSVSALRLGSVDLAFGNIFGSNMINIFIVFLCDIIYTKGPIFDSISQTHIFTVFLSIILTAVVLVGMRVKKKKLLCGIGWDSILMIICFLIGVRVMYILR